MMHFIRMPANTQLPVGSVTKQQWHYTGVGVSLYCGEKNNHKLHYWLSLVYFNDGQHARK